MAWIESHQSLLTHRKTARLARQLGVSKITAIGHLHALWWWAVDNTAAGDLSSLEAADIADGACWEGDAAAFVEALTYAGFVDADADGLRLHNWDQYTGRLVERREANAERMRRARATREAHTRPKGAAHVQRTSGARAGATGPNQTGPNQTGPDRRPGDAARTAAAVAPPEPVNVTAAPKRKPRDLGPLVDAFRAAGLSPPKFTGAEAKAAADLLAHWPPGDLAACWQDHASGEYGDDFSRRELSFTFLGSRNRVGNWDAWRQEAVPAEAPELVPRRPQEWCERHELVYRGRCLKCAFEEQRHAARSPTTAAARAAGP